MKTLIIVDLQNDFLPGGALPALEGDKVIPVINKLLGLFDLVIASKDWHPNDTVHFQKWPVHCVRESEGAGFPENFNNQSVNLTICKGTANSDDGYSAFEATGIDLDRYLQEKGARELYIAGLTTEYCVKNTVLDALNAGYKTIVIKDAVAGVKAHPGDEEKAWKEMSKAGAMIITSGELG